MQYIVQKYITFTWPYPYSFGIAGWPSNRFKKIASYFKSVRFNAKGTLDYFIAQTAPVASVPSKNWLHRSKK